MSFNPIEVLKVALYARVSTEEQREGQTIDSQIAELERFAREKGWQITGIYKDEGWSGSMLARPELDRLRDDASKKLFSIALVNDVDRLARDVSHLGIVKRDLEKHGTQVIFRKLPAEKSPTHNLMVNILGSFAEFERELIIDRTRRGRRHKVEVRKQYLGSNAAYGFRYIPKDKAACNEGYLELIPEEAAIVRQMFEWVDKEGLSAHRVAKRLSENGIHPRKGGDGWGKSSVLRILHSETYTGLWHYNKYEGCEPINPVKGVKYRRSLKSSIRLRDRSEWLPLVLPEHLKIIDREQWERVQRQLNQNIAFSPRNTKHKYLLKGLIRCGGCTGRYVGDPNHGKFYYRCSRRCNTYPSIREEYLDNSVWDAIKEAVLNPTMIADQLGKVYARRNAETESLKAEDKEIEEALKSIEKEESRILDAYRTGVISPAQLGRELEKLNIRKASLETRKGQMVSCASETGLPAIRRSLIDYCNIAAKRINSFSFEERQQFLRLLVDNIVLERGQLRVKGVIPISTRKENRASPLETGVEEQPLEAKHRIASSPLHSEDRNSVFAKGRIADMALYSRDRNSVEEIPFELAKSLPATHTPHRDMFSRDSLRSLVARHPRATLTQLCEQLRLEHGTVLSTTSMCRLLKQYGIAHNEKGRVEANNMPMALAA